MGKPMDIKPQKSQGGIELQIDPTKTASNTSNPVPDPNIVKSQKTSSLIDMQREMNIFFELLKVNNRNFDAENAFKSLMKYIRTYKRFLYSTVSHSVYDLANEDNSGKHASNHDRFGTLLSNIEKLVEYVDNDTNISNHVNAVREGEREAVYDTQKAVWKIWDHVNLAHRQYDELRQSDSEYDEKFQNRIEKVQGKISGEMNAQLLSMVGIFTALAFILFGGVSSLENILSGIQEAHLLKLLIVGCFWALGMMNVVFVFLFCIGKMTKLNIKSSMSPDANFWQRYPVVCWCNYLLCALLVIWGWLYYCSNRGSDSWLENLLRTNPCWVSIIGTVFIIILIIYGFRIMYKKTKATVGDEDQ